jgi:hypothetical protein
MATGEGSGGLGKDDDDDAREMVVAFQRALVPTWIQIAEYDRVTDEYSSWLDACAKRILAHISARKLVGQDLKPYDTSVWILARQDCVWPNRGTAAEELPNPLWAWLRASFALMSRASFESTIDVLMKTGCDSGAVINSCDGDGWSLLMSATRSERAYKMLRERETIDWAYERMPQADDQPCYSVLGESIALSDHYGVYAVNRLDDAHLSCIVGKFSNTVMHRIIASPNKSIRHLTLRALCDRKDVAWALQFTPDINLGSLATIAVDRSCSPSTTAYWDLFASPTAPWHTAFLAACESPAGNLVWSSSDPLRAASMRPSLPVRLHRILIPADTSPLTWMMMLSWCCRVLQFGEGVTSGVPGWRRECHARHWIGTTRRA